MNRCHDSVYVKTCKPLHFRNRNTDFSNTSVTGILFFRPVISAKGLNEISIHIQKINYIREGGGGGESHLSSLPESKF